ncbi:MAG: hypothetical protein DCF19_03655 [Pseudanabaena frigida]|uniref:Uncharacterized protein n=1 Tax=Pseudanabaena frigida TaxID=945775 RepID=A0A2W4WKM5_9CYAN|nr:MAG: hypothetical protein DCF19_03655 [Pseudanabaena frigida]
MRQFPVILIPPEVQRIAQSKPVAPEFNIELPSVPSYRQPKPIHIQEALSLTIGLILVVALVTVFAKELGIILLIVGTVAIVFRVRYQFQTYNRRYQKHQDNFQRYLSKLEAYSHQEIQYQRALAIAHAPDRILEHRHQQFKSFFAKLAPIENAIALRDASNPFANTKPTDDRAIEGVIYYFGITLQQHLSGTLYQGVKLYIPSIDYHWSPALTYVDPELNLHVAIEISLPSDNAAIMMRDDLAERFLVDSGWIIIKFFQEQILQNSAECCKEFAKLLDRLSLDPSVLPNFANTADLFPVKR